MQRHPFSQNYGAIFPISMLFRAIFIAPLGMLDESIPKDQFILMIDRFEINVGVEKQSAIFKRESKCNRDDS